VITRTRAIVLPDWAGKPVEEELAGWPVVARFEPPEGACGVGLTDLSHRPKAVLQGPSAEKLGALRPGQAMWTGHAYVGCLKPGEAIVFDLTGPVEPQWPDAAYTDVTDGWVLLGLWGPKSLDVVQRLVAADVERPDIAGPVYLAASSHGIRVQLINLRGRSPGFIVACDRSHAQNLFQACLRAGRQFDLKITGQAAFYDWFNGSAMSAPH
jgi:sarcosine oxidase gamma subunit